MTRFIGETVHQSLGPDFFDPVAPADFPQTILRYRNQGWARRVGLDHFTTEQWIAHFGRFAPLPSSFGTPLALRYHGHQFQAYNPDIGDGRGFLFAQMRDLDDKRLLDFGTKGSGTTPWSRGGDGRLTLKGGVREVLATAMLEARGVDTSKSFSLIETGESLYRGDEPSPTRSAVLVRLSHSHIRIGTFQRLAFLKDTANLARLVDHAIAHYYPHLSSTPGEERAAALMGAIAEAVAKTGAQTIAAGFVHGVLNTDNINITGESFDYGPWRFLQSYDSRFTAAYFDHSGLYAFGRQPDALAWNLTRLAECFTELGEIEPIEAALNRFWPCFQRELSMAIIGRLGFVPRGPETDGPLTAAFFAFLDATRPGYEQVFFDLFADGGTPQRRADSSNRQAYDDPSFATLSSALESYTPRPGANREHDYFARPTPLTMAIEDVEAIWDPIARADDWSAFATMLEDIGKMGAATGIVMPSADFTLN